jgi:hypothetical protein
MSRRKTSKIEEIKYAPKKSKNPLFHIMKDLPEEVIEDPNEQTHSEFPTKRAAQVQQPVENTLSTIQKIVQPHSLSNQEYQEHIKESKEPKKPEKDEKRLKKLLLDSKVVNFSTIDKAASFPDSKSVSLSFSSKYPEEEFSLINSNHNEFHSQNIIQKMVVWAS